MSVNGYREFLEKMGHRVLLTESACWFNVSSGFYMNFPFHRPVCPEPSEIREVLGITGIAVRHTCPPDIGRPSYKVVCTDKSYDLSSLPQKGRNRTRRGLESCSVKRLEFKDLESAGCLDLNRDTLIRQGRRVPANHDQYWRKYYSAAATSHCMEAWGAFAGDELSAYLIACKIEDCINILILRSHSKHLKANPNNALFFVFTGDAMSRDDVKEVSTGLESLQPDTFELERFKLRMGYQRIPIGQRIEFNYPLKLILRGPLLRRLHNTVGRLQGRENFDKLAGILRWYAEQPAV
jgi:hypothetical protein